MERTSSRDCKKLVPEHFRTGTSKKKKKKVGLVNPVIKML